jgi:hypothetical protein
LTLGFFVGLGLLVAFGQFWGRGQRAPQEQHAPPFKDFLVAGQIVDMQPIRDLIITLKGEVAERAVTNQVLRELGLAVREMVSEMQTEKEVEARAAQMMAERLRDLEEAERRREPVASRRPRSG